jgi:hypothetical protein
MEDGQNGNSHENAITAVFMQRGEAYGFTDDSYTMDIPSTRRAIGSQPALGVARIVGDTSRNEDIAFL